MKLHKRTRRAATTSIFTQFVPLINEVNRMEAMQKQWEQSEAGKTVIAQRNQEHNLKVAELAEKVYQAYLSEGVEIAEQRKQIYIQRNKK